MIIAQFYPLIWFFLWTAIIVGVCSSLFPATWLEDEDRALTIMGIPWIIGGFVLAKIYNNIFYYVKIPYGKIYYANDTVQFSSHLEILTPMKMCLLDTFKVLGKRICLYSKKNCMWINLSRTDYGDTIQYYSGSKEFNMRDLNNAYGLFYMGTIRGCSYYIIHDDNGSFYITDIDHYPEDDARFTLVASMISQNIYTGMQLDELDRMRGESSLTWLWD